MIVKMQKVTLLVRSEERESALQQLGRLGVVHLEFVKNPVSEDIDSLNAERERIVKALQIIGQPSAEQREMSLEEAAADLRLILEHSRRKDELRRELEELEEQRRWFREWGEVSWASIQRLNQAGLVVRFYVADRKEIETLPADRFIQIVGEEKKRVRLVHIASSPEWRLELKEEFMPPVEVGELDARIGQVRAEIAAIDQALDGLANARKGLLAYQADLEKRLEFNLAKYGMGEEASIAYLQGFCPADRVSQIREVAEREGWGYIFQEPTEEDEVPTLIRTPRWLRIVEPVFKFMGTTPGYREHDISFWFLIFFSIFFALLIGDAAYGLIFLLLTFYFSRKYRQAPREPFILMYVLSSATVVWGAISGTWFGYEGFAHLPFLKALIVDRVNSFVAANQSFMIYLCFLIGVIHLSVAHALIAVRAINSLRALAELGWIVILWSMFFVCGWIILGRPLPGAVKYTLAAGVLLVLFFANPQKNLLKGMLATLTDLPLRVISSFSDIVSYLRLFAVGTATVIMATSFNNMALSIGFDSIAGLGAACVLVLGHLINAVLGVMAVVVHGIRLNMLEFSGHLNMQWSGKPYKPFKMQ